ncbi:helix-turn-helix domain-containing protein [Oceanobacillus sp. 143]|uniref:Transcriptional regulator n=1 Tax=Oceanobacillus zhaokaii TaxID=2052660 RepID=A0A345PM60_9BACI|nr:helix-turn-helix domain-containing protein [Oceanobacillus zhaokaii]AXI11090.1 transcriptional regulator [Oceanobacillus zhaokaii]QGS68141.1 helix-turn-helix domain-containing protein [Oceanobacillus sp. 143]
MIEIGSFIKLQRTKQEKTLGELADGVVSVSYLSKIENLKTQASPEIIKMLCDRLGIQVDNREEELIKEKLNDWYSMLFEVNNKEDIIIAYEEIQEMLDRNLSENLLLFEIHKIRYFLILGDYDEAAKKINELKGLSNNFDSLQQFYWFKFRGNFYTLKDGDYNQSIKMYNVAEERISHIDISEDEIADLHYIISVTHSKLRNTLEAIEYANKALNIYMKLYNFLRCAQCHNILGISYRRIKMYDKAIKNYNLALHLGKLNNNGQLIQLTNQNLGHLYSVKGDSNEAIKYYLEIINNIEVQPGDKLASIASLVKEYYIIGNYEETRKSVDYGLALMKELSNIEPYKLFYYVIHTYNFLLNEEFESFERLVIEEFLPYLKKNKDFASLATHVKLLAEQYEKQHKYKAATKYFKEANFAYEQITNI